MNNLDLNVKLLLGKSINAGCCDLKPLILDEIDEVGFELYNKYLGALCISSDDIKNILGIEDYSETITEYIINPEDKSDENKINTDDVKSNSEDNFKGKELDEQTKAILNLISEPFEYIFLLCSQNEENKEFILNALKFFTKCEIEIDLNNKYFILTDSIGNQDILYNSNFNFFIDILKQQNCIDNVKNKVKPKNSKEKDFYLELEEKRKKYKVNENVTDMSDIMSAVCSKHPSINVFNINKLTIYQLIDQYKRLNMIEEYFISIESLLHGASKDDVKLVHWSSKQ